MSIVPRRWRSALGVFAVNAVLIALALLGAEAYARYDHARTAQYTSDNQLPMCEADQFRIWRYKPDVDFRYNNPEFDIRIRTNAEGLRSDPEAATGDGPLVVFIGDSFTFGWGVEENETFAEIARTRLANEFGVRVRIINAGHWMYTYDQQLLILKDILKKHRPAVVVQGLYWPHLRTLYNHVLSYDRAGSLVATSDPGIQVDERNLLKFRSDWLERPPLNSQLIALLARSVLNRRMVRDAANIEPYLIPGKTHNEQLWTATKRLLTETSRTVQSTGAIYLPLYIPSNVETSEGFWTVSWGKPEVPQNLNVRQPFERLRQIMSGLGHELIDPTSQLRPSATEAYFKHDVHFTARGHQIVGEFIAPLIGHAIK